MKSRRRCSQPQPRCVVVAAAGNSNNNNFILALPPEWSARHQRRLNQAGRQGSGSPHTVPAAHPRPQPFEAGDRRARRVDPVGQDGHRQRRRVVHWQFTCDTARVRRGSTGAAGVPREDSHTNQVAAPEHREPDRAQGRHPLSGVVGGSRFSRCGTGGQDHRHRYGRGHEWFNNPVAG